MPPRRAVLTSPPCSRLASPALDRQHAGVDAHHREALFVVLPRPDADAHPVSLRRSLSDLSTLRHAARERMRRATASGALGPDTAPDYASAMLPRALSPQEGGALRETRRVATQVRCASRDVPCFPCGR